MCADRLFAGHEDEKKKINGEIARLVKKKSGIFGAIVIAYLDVWRYEAGIVSQPQVKPPVESRELVLGMGVPDLGARVTEMTAVVSLCRIRPFGWKHKN